jgi:hypothetical protein
MPVIEKQTPLAYGSNAVAQQLKGHEQEGVNSVITEPPLQLQQIGEILTSAFALQRIDIDQLVKQVMSPIATHFLRCSVIQDQIVIEIANHRLSYTVEPRKRSMIRTMCARIAMLSHETTGVDPFLYGGEGEIHLPLEGTVRRFHVRTMNTTGQQWFEIHPLTNTPAPSTN